MLLGVINYISVIKKFTFLVIKFLNNEFYHNENARSHSSVSSACSTFLRYHLTRHALPKLSRGPSPRCQGKAGPKVHFIMNTFVERAISVFKHGIFTFLDIKKLD